MDFAMLVIIVNICSLRHAVIVRYNPSKKCFLKHALENNGILHLRPAPTPLPSQRSCKDKGMGAMI